MDVMPEKAASVAETDMIGAVGQPVAAEPAASASASSAAMSVVLALSLCHFLNDTMQSMLSAIYPMLKENYALTFGQSLETRTLNSAEVCENVQAVFLSDEAEAFSFVEPFNSAGSGGHNNYSVLV